MAKRFWAFALCLCIWTLCGTACLGQTLGPARSYDDLLAFAQQAAPGDVLLVEGEIAAREDAPLVTQASIRIRSVQAGHAVIHSLRLHDADVGFDGIDLLDTLSADGLSSIHLGGDVTVAGAPGREGILFTGSGALLIDRGARVTGGSSAPGISISHSGGDFYADIGGTIRGGAGESGGAGMQVSPLGGSGVMMISGDIAGGEGRSLGGHALNLYGLSGNALVSVVGALSGGSGHVGGNGMQVVSATDNVVIGVEGHIRGGLGTEFGGDALMLMNLEGSSSVQLTGTLTGGDATDPGAHPGTALLLVGDTTSMHTYINGCLLEDGRCIAAPQQDMTPMPTETAPEETPGPQPDTPDLPKDEHPAPSAPSEATPGEAERAA